MKVSSIFILLVYVLLPKEILTTTNSNNWYVLVSSSKFYFNYRHTLNILMVYDFLKSNNIPD